MNKGVKFLTLGLTLATILGVSSCNKNNSFTIEFETYGGNKIENLNYKAGEKIVLPSDPIKNPYLFGGRYLDTKFEEKFELVTMPNYDLYLYAKWTLEESTINFDSKGGSEVISIEGVIGDSAKKPTDPVKENCKFGGWYTDESFTQEFDFTFEENDKTAYAKWLIEEEGTKRSFNNNYIVNDEGSYIVSKTEKGYKIEIAGDKKDSWSFVKIPLKGDLQYYNYLSAKIKASEGLNYLIKIEGEGENSGVTATERKYIGNNEFTNLGFDLEKNNLPKEGKEAKILFFLNYDKVGGEGYIEIEELNLVHFVPENSKQNGMYTFNTNGGNNIEPLIIEEGKALSLPTPIKRGYIFEGWYIDEELTQIYSSKIAEAKNINLFAKWIENDTVKVTFNTLGGSLIEPLELPIGSVLNVENPIKDGVFFSNWYLDEKFTQKFDGIILDKDFTLFARYKKEEIISNKKFLFDETPTVSENSSYKVTNLTNSQKIEALSAKENYSAISVRHFTNSSYYDALKITFSGKEGDEILVKLANGVEKRFTMKSETQTIYWQYDMSTLNGLDLESTISLFIRPGKTGAGDNSFVIINELSYIKLRDEGDTRKALIEFDTTGGNRLNDIYVDEGTIPNLPTPNKPGFNFGGWYLDKELTNPFNINEPVNTYLKLYAKREMNQKINITFNTRGGSTIEALEVLAGGQILVENPAKDGYFFEDWYLDEDLTIKCNGFYPFESSTLYAGYNVIETSTTTNINFEELDETDSNYKVTLDGEITTIEAKEDKGEWNSVWSTGFYPTNYYDVLKFTFKGTAGEKVMIKLATGVEVTYTMSENYQTIYWDISEYNISDGSKLVDFNIFLRPGSKGKGNNAKITFMTPQLIKFVGENKTHNNMINFNLGIIEEGLPTIFAKEGESISLPTPVKEGYIFEGWYLDNNFINKFDKNIMPSESITLYAKWSN